MSRRRPLVINAPITSETHRMLSPPPVAPTPANSPAIDNNDSSSSRSTIIVPATSATDPPALDLGTISPFSFLDLTNGLETVILEHCSSSSSASSSSSSSSSCSRSLTIQTSPTRALVSDASDLGCTSPRIQWRQRRSQLVRFDSADSDRTHVCESKSS